MGSRFPAKMLRRNMKNSHNYNNLIKTPVRPRDSGGLGDAKHQPNGRGAFLTRSL